MVELAEIQAGYYMVAATGVLIAAIYSVMNIRYNMKAREMEICQSFASNYLSDQGMQRYGLMMTLDWKDYEDFMNKYGRSNPEIYGKWISQFFAFEAWGVLIKKKIISTELIYDLGGWGAIRTWDKYKDIIQGWRETTWGPDFLINTEYLVEEMLKIKMRRDASFQSRRKGYWWQQYSK